MKLVTAHLVAVGALLASGGAAAPLAAQPPKPAPAAPAAPPQPALPARGDTAALRRFVATLDTATVRRLCAAPDSVAAGRIACVLRNQGAVVRVF